MYLHSKSSFMCVTLVCVLPSWRFLWLLNYLHFYFAWSHHRDSARQHHVVVLEAHTAVCYCSISLIINWLHILFFSHPSDSFEKNQSHQSFCLRVMTSSVVHAKRMQRCHLEGADSAQHSHTHVWSLQLTHSCTVVNDTKNQFVWFGSGRIHGGFCLHGTLCQH